MSTTVGGLRERKNQRTREAITRAALELTLEVGFEHTTIAQIAERADVAPRTVYAWFASKEDIVVGPVPNGEQRLAAELADGDGDVLDRVRRWMRHEGELLNEDRELTRLRQRVLLDDAHLRATHRVRALVVEDVLAAAIAKDAGMAPDAVAPRALAAAITTTLLALQQRFVREADAEREWSDGAEPMLRAGLGALVASRGR